MIKLTTIPVISTSSGGTAANYFIREGDAVSNLYFNQDYTFSNFFENLTYSEDECDLLLTDKSRIFAIYSDSSYAIAEIPMRSTPTVGYVLYATDDIDVTSKYSWLKATKIGVQASTRVIKGTVIAINPAFKQVIDYFMTKEKYFFGLNQEIKNIIPSNTQQVITPSSGYDGIKQINVLTDTDLKAENIKSGVQIFNVTGTYTGAQTQTKTLEFAPGSSDSMIITPDEGYVLSGVEVGKPLTMIPSNIKKGVNIGGVVGTYEASSQSGYNLELYTGNYELYAGELSLEYAVNGEEVYESISELGSIELTDIFAIRFRVNATAATGGGSTNCIITISDGTNDLLNIFALNFDTIDTTTPNYAILEDGKLSIDVSQS